MKKNVAVFGAAGSMGTRVTNALKDDPDYRMLYVESGDVGQARLRERGVEPTSQEDAVGDADVVIFAVPDTVVGSLAREVVPALESGTLVVTLDPAAAYAGELPEREDVSYFVTHPAHPPIYNDETDPEARRDYFGSGKARQAIVNALMQGSEEDYARGEEIARRLWGPVLRSHRVTVEQMAILEPVLSETVTATCLTVIREAVDEAAERGVPFEAARDFVLGHINVELAILFDELEWELSAGAQMAVEEAKKDIFQPDWRKVFEPENIKRSVARITASEPA
jgi:D-apionate oxidoisomerase